MHWSAIAQPSADPVVDVRNWALNRYGGSGLTCCVWTMKRVVDEIHPATVGGTYKHPSGKKSDNHSFRDRIHLQRPDGRHYPEG